MPALKSYESFYDEGSSARKINKNEKEYVKIKRKADANRRYGKNKLKIDAKAKAKKNVKIVMFILCSFTMGMLITYRYNVISEKNLLAQNLKSELAAVEANLLNKQIEVEQNTELSKVEAYAKQKLGMQKPDKNQTIYIDTSKAMNSVEVNSQMSWFERFIQNIKDMINKFF